MKKEEMEQVINELQNALNIATERAVYNGERLIQMGHSDVNRGQFLSLVERANVKAVQALEKLKNN